ncbi:MAG: serine hydrolase [Myxococcales bacterium]|nr:serine hydrolase [Myxococcales bacterium]
MTRSLSMLLSCALLAGCGELDTLDDAAPVDEASEALEVQLAQAVPIGGIGGGFQGPFIGRWAQEPVVYRQYLAGGSSAAYGQAWQQWRDLGYHPAILDASRIGAQTRYSGLWYRDDQVLDWASHRDLLEADYLDVASTRQSQGYRLIDLDAHTAFGVTRYHSVWVREQSPLGWWSHRRIDAATLTQKISDYAGLGYRPLRINAYEIGNDLRYAAVWVRDGLPFHAHADLSVAQFNGLNAQYVADGYVLSDVGPFQVAGIQRVAATWVRDAGVQQSVFRRDLTDSQLEEQDETYTKQGLVMVDLNTYSFLGLVRHAAIWQRRVVRQTVQSNLPVGGDADIGAIGLTVTEFSTNGVDNRRGTIGFFVQDLQNGNYVTMNADEPFYLASTSKVLIGARVAAHPSINLNAQRTFQSTDWRGENTRGFTQANIGQLLPLQTYLTNMLIGSDTASTDVLHRLLVNLDGARGLDDWLRDVVGMQNVGEITDICTVDKRISANENTCVNSVSCDTFETWFRGSGGPYYNASQAERDCLDSLVDDRSVENHETYYTSLANTVTPAEFGRFWHRLAQGDLMDNADRAGFLATLDPSNNLGFNQAQGIFYDQMGTKNGGKRRVVSQVGIMWDWAGAVGDYTNVTPRYAFALFTEDWNFENTNDVDSNGLTDDTDWALAAMQGVLNRAIQFLDKQ